MQFPKLVVPLLALGLLFGCGGGGSLFDAGSPAQGTLNLTLGADSLPGYSQAVVSVEKVEWSSDGSHWNTLGTVKKTFDLVALQNGRGANGVLLSGVTLSPGTISRFRIQWATVNYNTAPVPPPAAYVTTNAGIGGVVTMPTYTEASGQVVVTSSGTTQAQIMIQGNQAFQNQTGTPLTCRFHADALAYDLAATARIAGRLSVGGTALSNVEVYAETLTSGSAAMVRRSFTDANGNYVLEALPAGSLYFVVAQPAGTPIAYYALASAGIQATAGATHTVNLPFDTPLAAGTLALTVTPASGANDGTWAELRQTLPSGLDFHTFIVRSGTAVTGSNSDQVVFAGLATSPAQPATYSARILRSTSGATPVAKDIIASQTITAGGTTSAATSLP